MNIMSFGEFEAVMNNLVKAITFENEIFKAVNKVTENGAEGILEGKTFVPPTDLCVCLLNYMFGEDDMISLIDFWVYDLECGTVDDCTYMRNGEVVELRTISDLYDALMYNVVYREGETD